MEWTGNLLKLDERLRNRNRVTVYTLLRVYCGFFDGYDEPAERYEVLTSTGWALLGDLRHSVGWYGTSTGLFAEEDGGSLAEWQERTNTVLVREDSLLPVHALRHCLLQRREPSGREWIKQVRR